jgi:hypothetical protein
MGCNENTVLFAAATPWTVSVISPDVAAAPFKLFPKDKAVPIYP